MAKSNNAKKPKSTANPSANEMGRRFVLGFILSSTGMLAAAAIYIFIGNQLAFDLVAQLLVVAFVLVGVLVGLWMIKTGEKHAGLGVIYGSLFGIILAILAVILLSLLFIAVPVTGS